MSWKVSDIKGKKVSLIGDGRYDSQRHSVKYMTYTIMDPDSQKFVDTTVVAVSEVIYFFSVSNLFKFLLYVFYPVMEKFGLERLLRIIIEDEHLEIKFVSTDRHNQIRKHMRVKYPAMKHLVDPWIVLRNLLHMT